MAKRIIERIEGACKSCGRTLIIEKYVKGFKSLHAVPACAEYLRRSGKAAEVAIEHLPIPEFPEGKPRS